MSNPRRLDPASGDNIEAAFRRAFPALLVQADSPQRPMRADASENADGFTVTADLPAVEEDTACPL